MPATLSGSFDPDATIAALKRKTAAVDRVSAVALRRAGFVVERAIKEKLSEQGRHRPGTPTPSSPGEPPKHYYWCVACECAYD
jgi:hypothetical protein